MAALLREVRACRVCAADLPLGPKPVLRASPTARLLIIGQAPGTRVHATGIPWNDPSGDRLRAWLGVDRETFYDESRIAITPMGFCYPGKGRSGDLPPRPECAPLWHARLQALMPKLELVLLVGQYAQRHYLNEAERSLAEIVRDFRRYGPRYLPLPHPSPRNQLWLRRNPWFEREVLPVLRRRVARILAVG
ncbi:MAG TPA: uracil-DNA glycosylase family protein [Nevskiales bacterium]|nr:uracil-DNA glycosylase family protein [Nevskiales bacterium]